MSLLSGIAGKALDVATGPARLYIEAAVALALLGVIGGQTWRLHTSQAVAAEAKADLSAYRANVERTARLASEAARAEETRRTAAQKEIADETQRLATRNRTDRVAADGAHGELSKRADALAAGGCAAAGNPDPATGGPATPDAAHLLADVLKRADQRAGELAAYADEARTAGLACQRAYEALTP